MIFLGFWLCEAESKRDQKGETKTDQKSYGLKLNLKPIKISIFASPVVRLSKIFTHFPQQNPMFPPISNLFLIFLLTSHLASPIVTS